jgi:hypothetical protein
MPLEKAVRLHFKKNVDLYFPCKTNFSSLILVGFSNVTKKVKIFEKISLR